jgi:hypothetical protein
MRLLYCLAENYGFERKRLKEWLRRQIKFYFRWRFFIYLHSNNKSIAWRFFGQTLRRYPFIITTFLNPRNFILLILGSNNVLYKTAIMIKKHLERRTI